MLRPKRPFQTLGMHGTRIGRKLKVGNRWTSTRHNIVLVCLWHVHPHPLNNCKSAMSCGRGDRGTTDAMCDSELYSSSCWIRIAYYADADVDREDIKHLSNNRTSTIFLFQSNLPKNAQSTTSSRGLGVSQGTHTQRSGSWVVGNVGGRPIHSRWSMRRSLRRKKKNAPELAPEKNATLRKRNHAYPTSVRSGDGNGCSVYPIGRSVLVRWEHNGGCLCQCQI